MRTFKVIALTGFLSVASSRILTGKEIIGDLNLVSFAYEDLTVSNVRFNHC